MTCGEGKYTHPRHSSNGSVWCAVNDVKYPFVMITFFACPPDDMSNRIISWFIHHKSTLLIKLLHSVFNKSSLSKTLLI